MTGSFDKFTLATDFSSKDLSPGFPYAVYPNGQKDGERAHIVVAGDDDDSAFLLTPTGDASKFEYEKDLITDIGGVVGALATYDVDGDGWLELFVPNYNDGYIEVFKMSAPGAPTEFLQ